MGVVKLPRVCELSFHSESDEVASKGVKREGLSLWDVLPRVCGGHAALTVQPAIRVRQTLIFEPVHIMLYTSTSRQASAPNLQSGVCPGEPTGARRLPKPLAKKTSSSLVSKILHSWVALIVEAFFCSALEPEQ